MVVVVGELGSGKIMFGFGFVEWVVLVCNELVLVFSLEMIDVELVNCVLLLVGSVLFKYIVEGYFMVDFDWLGLIGVVNKFNYVLLIFCDDVLLIFWDICQICWMVKCEYGLGMVVVDYIGLIKGEQCNVSCYDVVIEISKGLKCLVKEFGVFVVVLVQFNCGLKVWGNKCLIKSDLCDFGQIEVDVDVVVLVYWDQESDVGKVGIIELIVDKN